MYPKKDMAVTFSYSNDPIFLSATFGRGNLSQKRQFLNKAVQKGCLFTLSHQGLQCLAMQKNIFVGKWSYLPTFWIARRHNTLDWNV